MRRLPSLLLILLLAGALPACEVLDPIGGEVSAYSLGEVLFAANGTSDRIYYFVVGRGTAATINWAPHLDPEQSVARKTTARIRHADIFRSETEDEVIVYWWHAARRDGQRVPDEIQALVVTL